MPRVGIVRGFLDRWKGRSEGRIFVLGILGMALVLAELGLVWLWRPKWGAGLLEMVGVENVAGREAGMPLAAQAGVPAWLMAQVSFLQDISIVALAFPLFLYLLGRFHDRDNLLMRRLRRIERAAQERQHLVDRWGAVGIYAFMIVPFLINGPLVGAVLGRLAGMHTRALVKPVLLATATAAAAWAYAYDRLYALVRDVDTRLTVVLTALIFAVIVTLMLVQELREERRERGGAPPAAP
ncbi:MAG TPA: small multi-drug export protein [Candidatus Thermoplasmatota archaeon]|nr:small multi-drug export protein [Candidatus Thermoplasmatota archaeon]